LSFGIVQKTVQRYDFFRKLYRFVSKKIKTTFYKAWETTFEKKMAEMSQKLGSKKNLAFYLRGFCVNSPKLLPKVSRFL